MTSLIISRAVIVHASHVELPLEARHHLLGDRERRGEPRRFDAEQMDEPRHAVLGRRVDHEIGRQARRGR